MDIIKLEKEVTEYIHCIDYTVSKENYTLIYNKEYDLLKTTPVPKNIAEYYESNEYISHTDSNKSIIDNIYKTVRNYTLKNKLKLINSFQTNDKKLLDIGAGTGDFLNICKQNKWQVNGVEPSEKARKIAFAKGINCVDNTNNIKGKFDIITMWHVLEHVEDIFKEIRTLKSLLNNNGVLIIAVPNYKSYDAKYYKEFWAAYDVPRHLWHFSRTSITKLFSEINMDVTETIPMLFDSYYVSLLSEKYKTGKMNPFKAIYIGLLSNMKGKRNKQYSSHIYIIKNSKN